MAKDYFKVEPDRVAILGRNQNIGRGGRKIRYITRHHTAGVLNADQINAVWRDRPASAHYLIDPNGIVSQHVWDANTAWSNANSVSNQESITIEHSNSAGPAQDWPINPVTIDEGARWAAALCRYYNLGRPEYGKNIRDHREFASTSCPYHLAAGGKYHDRYMRIAQEHYDWMAAGGKTPESKPQEGITVSEADRIIKHLQDFIVGYLSPLIEDTKDNRFQLTGSRDNIPGDVHASYPGFEQLGKNADGHNLTLVDAVAALRQDVDALRKEIKR